MSDRKSWKLPYWIIPSTALAIVLITVGLLVAFPPKWEWLGVGESQEVSQETKETIEPQSKQKTITTIKHEQAKNLWDWFSLLGVPISVAFLGWWLQYLQQKQIEENQREEVLQAYFDRISTLLIDRNVLAISTKVKNATELEAEQQDFSEQKELLDAAADVIRARTLSILRRLENDPVRKASVLLFLSEAEVIRKLNVDLAYANLEGANLESAELEGAKLKGARLNKAGLIGASLNRADLYSASLIDARLIAVRLDGAVLHNAKLTRAILIRASLNCADLGYAKLDFAILQNASLKGAKLDGAKLDFARLNGASFEGASLDRATLYFASLEGADLRGASLKGTRNMTPAQIKKANNWQLAHYDPDFREKLGLPPEKP